MSVKSTTEAAPISAWTYKWVSSVTAPTTWGWCGTASVRVSDSLALRVLLTAVKLFYNSTFAHPFYKMSWIYLREDCGFSFQRGSLFLTLLHFNRNWVSCTLCVLQASFLKASLHLEINMCLESDVCDQLCVHMNGTPTCDCRKDYWMNPVTGECKAKGNNTQMISRPVNKPLINLKRFRSQFVPELPASFSLNCRL